MGPWAELNGGVSLLLPGLWACQYHLNAAPTEPSGRALPSVVSELSLLMEYFRLFSSICNKRQEGILSSQTSGGNPQLTLRERTKALFQPHPLSLYPPTEPAFAKGGPEEERGQTEVCQWVSKDCREASRRRLNGDNDGSSPVPLQRNEQIRKHDPLQILPNLVFPIGRREK